MRWFGVESKEEEEEEEEENEIGKKEAAIFLESRITHQRQKGNDLWCH